MVSYVSRSGNITFELGGEGCAKIVVEAKLYIFLVGILF